MNNKKGYTAVVLVIVIAVFTDGYFVTANLLSRDFDVDYEQDLYDLKIAAIEEQAAIYGEAHTEIFAEGNDAYMTVEELALENVIISTSEGVVADPRNSEETLNDLRVKITSNDDEVTAEVLA